jgi:hypothetical protein
LRREDLRRARHARARPHQVTPKEAREARTPPSRKAQRSGAGRGTKSRARPARARPTRQRRQKAREARTPRAGKRSAAERGEGQTAPDLRGRGTTTSAASRRAKRAPPSRKAERGEGKRMRPPPQGAAFFTCRGELRSPGPRRIGAPRGCVPSAETLPRRPRLIRPLSGGSAARFTVPEALQFPARFTVPGEARIPDHAHRSTAAGARWPQLGSRGGPHG